MASDEEMKSRLRTEKGANFDRLLLEEIRERQPQDPLSISDVKDKLNETMIAIILGMKAAREGSAEEPTP